MTFRDVISVLSFAAFRPEPDDPSATWKKRFGGRKSLFIAINRAGVAWKAFNKSGSPSDGESFKGDTKELLAQTALQARDLTEDGWVGVALNTRYVVSLETNLSRRPGSEEVIKSNPRSVLGARYERGKSYAVTHNPESNTSILLAYEDEHIRKMEVAIREAGLNPARICCGTYMLLNHALQQANPVKSGEPTARSFFYVICCQGAVLALLQDADRWVELRSRTDVYDDSMEPVIDLLEPFKSRVKPEMEVIITCDQPQPELVSGLESLLPGYVLKDLSKPDLLWNLMFEN
jgi:hypothetical protein